MSFRQNRNLEWKNWINKHRSYLTSNCGIPDYLLENEKRWFVFLDHGYDEVGWFENHHSGSVELVLFESHVVSHGPVNLKR